MMSWLFHQVPPFMRQRKIFSKQHQLPNVKFIPLVGGLGTEHLTIQSNRVCELLATNSGGRSVELHAPITLDDIEAKQVLMKQSFIKKSWMQLKQRMSR